MSNFLDAIKNINKIANNAVTQAKNAISNRIRYSINNGYDPDIETFYKNTHDYSGLADYLENFRKPTAEENLEYINEIHEYRTLDKKYKALYSKASNTEKDALDFTDAFDEGNIDFLNKDNEWNKEYRRHLDILGKNVLGEYKDFLGYVHRWDTDKADPVSVIDINFNNRHKSYSLWGFGPDFLSEDEDEDQFSKFCEDTGYTEGDIKRLLGEDKVWNNDGRTSITIDKTNLKAIKFLCDVNKWADETGRDLSDVVYTANSKDYPDGYCIDPQQVRNVRDLIERSQLTKDGLIERVTNASNKINSTVTMPFVNSRQAQLYQLYAAGQISDDDLKGAIEIDNAIYDRLLLGNNFGNLEMYRDVNGTLVKIESNEDRQALHPYISAAIKENRVERMAGFSNGTYGYYLHVKALRDEEKVSYDEGDARNEMMLFFPGLFTESVQTAFNGSTEGKTIKTMDEMQDFGFDYDLPNGDKIKNLGNYGAEYFDAYNKTTKSIDRETAKKYIESGIVVEDGSLQIENKMFNTDGSLRKGYDYNADAKTLAVATINSQDGTDFDVTDVFAADNSPKLNDPNSSYARDEEIQKAYNIYKSIMNRIFKILNK